MQFVVFEKIYIQVLIYSKLHMSLLISNIIHEKIQNAYGYAEATHAYHAITKILRHELRHPGLTFDCLSMQQFHINCTISF